MGFRVCYVPVIRQSHGGDPVWESAEEYEAEHSAIKELEEKLRQLCTGSDSQFQAWQLYGVVERRFTLQWD